LQSHYQDFHSVYEKLFHLLLTADKTNSLDDLELARPFFWNYLLIAEEHGLDTSLLHAAYVKLVSLINNPLDESISFYGDVIIPVGRFQIRYEQEWLNTVEQTKALAIHSSDDHSYHAMDALLQTKKIPGFIAQEIKDTALNFAFQVHVFAFIPADIMSSIFVLLELKEISRLSQTCRRYYSHGLFQIQLMENGKLLDYSLKANPKAAMKLLDKLKMQSPDDWWKCILKKSSGTEPCGRKWKSISALEFLTFNGDFCFRRKLLSSIPQEGYVEALEQIMGVINHGLEGRKRHAPIAKLIFSCDFYVDNYDNYNYFSNKIYSSKISKEYHCIKYIGKPQYEASCFGLQLLCDEDFNSNGKELMKGPPQRELWLDRKRFMFVNSGLGESFYIMNSNGNAQSFKFKATLESMMKTSKSLSKILKQDDKLLREEISFLQQEIGKQNQVKPK